MFSRAQNTFRLLRWLLLWAYVFFCFVFVCWCEKFDFTAFRDERLMLHFWGEPNFFPLLLATNLNEKKKQEKKTEQWWRGNKNFRFRLFAHVLKPDWIVWRDGGQQMKPILDLVGNKREECFFLRKCRDSTKRLNLEVLSFFFECLGVCGCFNWVIHLLAFFLFLFCLYLLDSVACFDN